ncbi:hypothetical protein QYE76_036759 [Lolium multiflorum]|uniref:TF-B3 domain-containing protein n=1 Tax=Lolium multiflorum TaxID=4521 RepID=A0AAD8VPN1_LOLMU|nr:hypothetical protein QYE76_036759 [Lolium multiflorum]
MNPLRQVPEAISRIPEMGSAARRLRKVFRIVALGTGGFATEALSRRKGRSGARGAQMTGWRGQAAAPVVPRWRRNPRCCAALHSFTNNLHVAFISYWFDKPWFLTEGKLAAVLIIPSSWGSQRTCALPSQGSCFHYTPALGWASTGLGQHRESVCILRVAIARRLSTSSSLLHTWPSVVSTEYNKGAFGSCSPLVRMGKQISPIWMAGPSRVVALTGSQSILGTGPGGTPGMAVSPGPGPLWPESCTRGEGRRRRRILSGTRAIISLTAPLSYLSLVTAVSPPPNCHITRRFPSRRPIRRTDAGRSTATGGGDVGDQDLDIGRNLLRSPHRHLVFARDLELILCRKNGGKSLSFSPSYSFCSNMPFLGISDNMHIRSARVSVRIAVGLMFCKTKKIKLGSPAEVPGEGPTKKRRGRPAKVGHFHDEPGLDHFLKIIFKPTFGRLIIPRAFVKWFGDIPSNIIVTTNTGCNWRMTTRREGDDAFIDQGWSAFAIANQLKVGQFVTFRRVSSLEYRVVIFDHTCTEVVTRCPYHGDDTRREMNHIATGTAPSLDGELLPHGSSSGDEDGGGDGSGVDGEAFRGHFPVRQAANRDSCPDLGFAMAAALTFLTVASSVGVFRS